MDLVLGDGNLLTEILHRLPAKSLIRYKLICKKWLSLISSDYFGHRHTLRRSKLEQSLIIQMQTMQCFYFNRTISGGKVMIPYSLTVPDHQILQDCNGLLLLVSEHLRHYVYNPTTGKLELNQKNSYYVYNPTTRQSRKINLTNNDKFPYVEAITLAFDPSKSCYYKVVYVRSTSSKNSPDHTYQIDVYTWKLSLEPSICPRINNDGVRWNNSIFWSLHGRGDVYCCFNIAKNEIKSLSCSTPRPHQNAYLQESNGRLYHFELLEGNKSTKIAVWELGGDDHSQWLSKYHAAIRENGLHIRPMRIVRGWDGDGPRVLGNWMQFPSNQLNESDKMRNNKTRI